MQRDAAPHDATALDDEETDVTMERSKGTTRFAVLAGLLAMLAGAGDDVRAQAAGDYPSKPIRMIVGSSTGGPNDIRARQLAPKMTESLKQSVVVENRPGASGSIAAEAVARAPADGYTLLLGGVNELAVFPAIGGQIRYDPAKDFVTVSHLTYGWPLLLVNPASGIRTVADLIARAKAAPDSLTCGTEGHGTNSHLACAIFAKRAGVSIRPVPYKGAGPAIMDTASGQVTMTVAYLIAVEKQFIEPGKLVPLAIYGPQRLPSQPNVPTLAEAGMPGVEISGWIGLFAPAGTPAAIVEKLNAESIKGMRDPVIAESLRMAGTVSMSSSPAVAAEFVRKEQEKWRWIAAETGIKVEQ